MKPISEMTDLEIDEALAVEMGWHKEKHTLPPYKRGSYYWVNALGKRMFPVCNYAGYPHLFDWYPTSDLNQVREIEQEKITDVNEGLYCMRLNKLGSEYDAIHASARQKCEALLATFREVKNNE